jgi:hypothetical protein
MAMLNNQVVKPNARFDPRHCVMMTPCRAERRAALRSLSPGDASGSAHGGPASRGSSSTSPCLDQCGDVGGCKAGKGHLKGGTR